MKWVVSARYDFGDSPARDDVTIGTIKKKSYRSLYDINHWSTSGLSTNIIFIRYLYKKRNWIAITVGF